MLNEKLNRVLNETDLNNFVALRSLLPSRPVKSVSLKVAPAAQVLSRFLSLPLATNVCPAQKAWFQMTQSSLIFTALQSPA